MTDCGFLLYERPIEVTAGEPGDQVLLDYAGFSWHVGRWREDGTGSPGFLAASLTTYHRWPVDDDGRLARDIVGPWQFDREPSPHERYWWPLVQTTLRLMQEWRPASRYTERPDRPARRAAARAGFHDRDIIVVRLRRERSPSEPLGGSANYSHRFLVSGHWRNQWCPAANTHRQTWISPYVKGPADKPLKTPAGRAFVLSR